MKASTQLRRILRFAAVALTAAVVVFLVRSIRRDGPAALQAWHSAPVRWGWIAFSVACAATGHAFYVIGWRRLLGDAGARATSWQLARIFLVSNLGRYLPGGKAWQMGIIGMMAAEHGLPAATLAASSLFQGVIGIGVGAIVLFAAGGSAIGLPIPWLALPLAGVAALLAGPTILRSSPRLLGLVTRRMTVVGAVTTGTMWMLIWTSAVSWLLWGIALYALGSAVLSSPSASVGSYIAAWSGSFLAGLIAVVSPAGLGAREGVMQAVLRNAGVGPGDVLVIVVIARVWGTILDVVPAMAVLLYGQRRRAGAQPRIAVTDAME